MHHKKRLYKYYRNLGWTYLQIAVECNTYESSVYAIVNRSKDYTVCDNCNKKIVGKIWHEDKGFYGIHAYGFMWICDECQDKVAEKEEQNYINTTRPFVLGEPK